MSFSFSGIGVCQEDFLYLSLHTKQKRTEFHHLTNVIKINEITTNFIPFIGFWFYGSHFYIWDIPEFQLDQTQQKKKASNILNLTYT